MCVCVCVCVGVRFPPTGCKWIPAQNYDMSECSIDNGDMDSFANAPNENLKVEGHLVWEVPNTRIRRIGISNGANSGRTMARHCLARREICVISVKGQGIPGRPWNMGNHRLKFPG